MSDFNKNILVLLSGTTIAQAVPIAFMPILTRLYSPKDFGVLAIFVAITSIFGSVANARYELAIVLPESEDDALTVAALGILVATIFSLILVIPFAIYNSHIVAIVGNADVSIWLYFVPLVVWIVGLYNVANFLNTRTRRYKDIAVSQIYRATALVLVQLMLSGFSFSGAGLIVGQMASHLAALKRSSNKLPNLIIAKRMAAIGALVDAARRFKKFFIYMLPATLMNAFSSNLITLCLPTLFSISTLGFYSLAQRALGVPSALIGTSISQVFMQEAAEEKKSTEKISKSFFRALRRLVALSFIFFIPLYFIAEELFAFVFGAEWREAGTYTKILIPYFAINFIVSSVSVTDSVIEKQYIYATFNILLVLGASSIILLVEFENVLNFLFYLSMYNVLCYLAYLATLCYIVRK